MNTWIPTALLALLTTACATSNPDGAVDVDQLGIPNLAISADRELLTAGQLTEEQFAALPAAGYDTVICLRNADETGTGWEDAFAAAHGIHFVRIPIDGEAGLSRENAEALATAMGSAEHGSAIYCGSSNRVGALLALKAHFLDGLSIDDAIDLGKQHGMTRIEPAARKALEAGR